MINIVIPMAGRGSRFEREGYQDPKPLIEVEGKRMIELVINNLRPDRPHKFIFICQESHIKKYDLDSKLYSWAPGCEVVSIEGVTEGAACTALCAKSFIDDDSQLMIANSDQWVDIDIDEYLSCMDDESIDGLIMTMKASDNKWSYVKLGDNGMVTEVVEKVVVSDEATVGIYNFRRGMDFVRHAEKMIENNERSNGEFYVAPVYSYMYSRQGSKIAIYNIGSEGLGMYGLGIPSDLNLFKSLDVCKKATDF